MADAVERHRREEKMTQKTKKTGSTMSLSNKLVAKIEAIDAKIAEIEQFVVDSEDISEGALNGLRHARQALGSARYCIVGKA